MNATPDIQRFDWWSGNRRWLPAALLVAAASVGYAWYNGRADYALKNRVEPINVGKGQVGPYEGARWQVIEAAIDEAPDPRLRLHPDAALLRVVFEVTPDAGTTAARLDQCRGQVSDGKASRRWNAYGSLPLGLADRMPHLCGGGGEAASGPVRFQHSYEVPRGMPVAMFQPEIHFLVAEKSAPGEFLRFKL